MFLRLVSKEGRASRISATLMCSRINFKDTKEACVVKCGVELVILVVDVCPNCEEESKYSVISFLSTNNQGSLAQAVSRITISFVLQ